MRAVITTTSCLEMSVLLQQVIEVVKIARIADGNQHVAGTHLHLLAIDQRLLGDAELLAHLMMLLATLPCE